MPLPLIEGATRRSVEIAMAVLTLAATANGNKRAAFLLTEIMNIIADEARRNRAVRLAVVAGMDIA